MGRQAWSVKEGGEGHLHGTARQGRRGEVRKAWSGFDRQGSTRQAGSDAERLGEGGMARFGSEWQAWKDWVWFGAERHGTEGKAGEDAKAVD